MITGGPSDCKGKNKCTPKDVWSVKQEPWTKQEIKFGLADRVTESLHNDPLIIRLRLNRFDVKRVLVDITSSLNLLTSEIFNKLGLDKNNLW